MGGCPPSLSAKLVQTLVSAPPSPSTNIEVKPCNTSVIPQLDGNTSNTESESNDSRIIQPNIQSDKIPDDSQFESESNCSDIKSSVSYCRDNNIHQLDGNCSLLSDGENIQDNLISNRVAAAVHLPSIASYNVRSFFPKVRNIRTDILERGITLGFFSEIWEQSENKKHKFLIESMLETDGLKYISTPRPKGWGGAAIVANQRNFKLEKLDVAIPHNLEVVWGLLSSKSGNARFRKILVCSFYSPPRSKKNKKNDRSFGYNTAHACYKTS